MDTIINMKNKKNVNRAFIFICGLFICFYVNAQTPMYVTTTTLAGGNTIPFYYTGTGCRGQQLYPVGSFGTVPGGMMINRLYFAFSTAGTQLYSNMEIRIGQANISVLSTTYEVGLTQALNEVNWSYTRGA